MLSLVMGLIVSAVSAQTDAPQKETVYQDWLKLGESSNHVDVFYRVVKCESVNQVHLLVFNESGIDQLAKFSLLIADENGKRFTRNITFSTKNAGMYQADCGSDASLKDLRINVPEGYDPARLDVKITFNF